MILKGPWRPESAKWSRAAKEESHWVFLPLAECKFLIMHIHISSELGTFQFGLLWGKITSLQQKKMNPNPPCSAQACSLTHSWAGSSVCLGLEALTQQTPAWNCHFRACVPSLQPRTNVLPQLSQVSFHSHHLSCYLLHVLTLTINSLHNRTVCSSYPH